MIRIGLSVFRTRINQALAACCLVYICLLLTGCGGGQNTDGPQRYGLEGTVIFEGTPVPKGEISFRPDPSAGNRGPGGYAVIEQGKFKVEADKGVVGGDYIFSITGYDGVPIATPDFGEPSETGKMLFANVEIKKVLPKEDSEIELEIPVPKNK
ncbi:hypothetical protein [uncultured Gimesia sp.]|uniref:hypothetical protein n=1 Tax=uncultured Gimesia sp. TaxID=1678688 RepID=UPI0030DBD991|tara:strand:+ start:24339 stop:24800 length:462 start_codon:yes stop_codon:yes gene_type:complete